MKNFILHLTVDKFVVYQVHWFKKVNGASQFG